MRKRRIIEQFEKVKELYYENGEGINNAKSKREKEGKKNEKLDAASM